MMRRTIFLTLFFCLATSPLGCGGEYVPPQQGEEGERKIAPTDPPAPTEPTNCDEAAQYLHWEIEQGRGGVFWNFEGSQTITTLTLSTTQEEWTVTAVRVDLDGDTTRIKKIELWDLSGNIRQERTLQPHNPLNFGPSGKAVPASPLVLKLMVTMNTDPPGPPPGESFTGHVQATIRRQSDGCLVEGLEIPGPQTTAIW